MTIIDRLVSHQCHCFYYFSLFDNINSILEKGILPKNTVNQLGINYTSFANVDVQSRRHTRQLNLSGDTRFGIHDFVPVYLTPRSPTLYAVRESQPRFFMCVIDNSILNDHRVSYAFSDGNMANAVTELYVNVDDIEKISWDVIHAAYWTDYDGGKRRRNAEFLIRPSIMPEYITEIAVLNSGSKGQLESMLTLPNLNKCSTITVNPDYFF